MHQAAQKVLDEENQDLQQEIKEVQVKKEKSLING